jgi:phenylacetate-CoA ligase
MHTMGTPTMRLRSLRAGGGAPLRVADDRAPRLDGFADLAWDYAPREHVTARLEELLAAQLRFAIEHVPFWRKRLAHLDPRRLEPGPALLAAVPLLHKREMRLLEPFALAPQRTGSFHIVRTTGGTTGAPVPLIWTAADWNAAIHAIGRFLDPVRRLAPKVVFNCYNQAHAAGPSFDDVARLLGATPVARGAHASDLDTVRDIERFGAQVIVLTPRSGSGKGGSLEDLLAIEPNFLERAGVRALLMSSTPLGEDLVAELRAQGVDHVVNLYGSTEGFPQAISCAHDPMALHLCQGPNFVEVLRPDGTHVAGGERGQVVVSRLGGVEHGGVAPAGGTQLFRLVVGDEVTYVDSPCACGRTSPRIKDVVRVANLEDKAVGGCERWE